MRITNDMIEYQLNIANKKLEDTNKRIRVTSSYGYKAIEFENIETTGSHEIKTGLTTKEVYNCLYTYNELTYMIDRELKENNEA